MRKVLWLLPVAVLLAVVAIVGIEIWGGVSRSATTILRNGDRVEVFRVSSKRADGGVADTIGGRPILATGKEQGPDFAARLGRVLRSWSVAPSSKKCAFEPGVAFRIWRGDKALEVLICFKCDDLWPHVVGESGSFNDEVLAFDPVRAELVALAKEAFPDDPTIQALPSVHPGESAFYPEPEPAKGDTTKSTKP
jgi:hypothetical protein